MSSESQRKWRREHRHPCLDCGKPIEVRAKRCKECSYKRLKTEHGRNWKGGRVHATGGYIEIWMPEHPKARKSGYVFEHTLKWEEANNKPLPDGWIIHHLNGIKDDNQPKNLVALPSKKHFLVLQAKAKRIQELEALLNDQHQLL
jgi:DNA-directed RNA polymerase subunit RPC12/RpoP